VLWESTSGTVAIWEMNGANLSGFVANAGMAPANAQFAGVGHFTGAAGSTSDIVWVDAANHVTIRQMSNGHLANTVDFNGRDGSEWHLRGVGNFAGDANSDLLWVSNTGAVNIWKVNGANITEVQGNVSAGGSQQPQAGLAGAPTAATSRQQTAAPLIMSDVSQLPGTGAAADAGKTTHTLIGS
jgi:hypothetical protein